jgi:hypothetical protein
MELGTIFDPKRSELHHREWNLIGLLLLLDIWVAKGNFFWLGKGIFL